MLKRLLAITQKEFILIRRDRGTLVLIVLIPLIQLMLFAYAIHMDVKHIPMVVADQSLDAASRSYVADLVNSDYFELVGTVQGERDAVAAIDRGSARVAVVIPPDFASRVGQGEASVLMFVDGSDPFTTQSAYHMANAITQNHALQLVLDRIHASNGSAAASLPPLSAHIRTLYNPDLQDLWFLVPGLVAMLLQTQAITLTALSLVRERQFGTMEQILVTPIRPVELMVGKTLPNLLVAMIDMLVIVALGTLLFGVPIQGSFVLYGLLTILYVFSGLALGLLISSFSQNQRQAQQLTMMFTFIGLIVGGFVFPRYAMPVVLQWVSCLFPLTFFIPISRGIFLKGIGIHFLGGQVAALVLYVAVVVFLAVRVFRERLD